MKEQLKSIDERAKEELSHIDDAKLLEDFRVRFLGKKGEDNFHYLSKWVSFPQRKDLLSVSLQTR